MFTPIEPYYANSTQLEENHFPSSKYNVLNIIHYSALASSFSDSDFGVDDTPRSKSSVKLQNFLIMSNILTLFLLS